MSSSHELYQQIILDHNKSPKNFGAIEHPSHKADGYNPLCGDQITVTILLDESKTIRDIRFEGSGCAISKASASLMTLAIKGKTIKEALEFFERFHQLITKTLPADFNVELFGRLNAFSSIWEYPSRIKCASLPWYTMKAALEKKLETIVTE